MAVVFSICCVVLLIIAVVLSILYFRLEKKHAKEKEFSSVSQDTAKVYDYFTDVVHSDRVKSFNRSVERLHELSQDTKNKPAKPR